MDWLGIDPQSIRHILITVRDTDHVGAVGGRRFLFVPSAKLYIGEIENRYLTGEGWRKVIYHLYKRRRSQLSTKKRCCCMTARLSRSDSIKIECFNVPGHT